MKPFEPSEFQKEIMGKLWAIRNNFGPNVIQLQWRMRMKSRVDRKTVLSLPIEVTKPHVNEIFIDAPEVVELFENNFIDQISRQSEEFIRIGESGISWCMNNEEIAKDAGHDK